MAGEWIKFECNLPEKPEVLAITAALGWDDPDLTVGKLMRLFRWFDQQTVGGNAAGVTPALLDRIIGVSGFAQAVANVGWLHFDAHGVSLEKFDRHNGASAKARAQTAKRVANHRGNAAGNGVDNADRNADGVTAPLAREREEKNKNPSGSSATAKPARKPRGARVVPSDFVVTDDMAAWVQKNAPAVDWRRETEKFRDWEFKHPRSDWGKVWRTWMRKAQEDAERGPGRRGGSAGAADWTGAAT
jgi:hypothetical protein